MSKQKVTSLLGIILTALIMCSCAAPNYLPVPDFPIYENKGSFFVQNMDNNAKVEPNVLTCHYDGFDVIYTISDNFIVAFDIINNTNKSLIIDKSKSYVLYNGYSTQLFKDVRSSRSTTFNNVQDAINNVQTNEGGVSMTIPPYSKWQSPLNETNLRRVSLPDAILKEGRHSLTPHDNKETVEFVIPYSYDYSMAKWKTCRNRIYVGSIETKLYYGNKYNKMPHMTTSNEFLFSVGIPDLAEAKRVDAINRKKYNAHRTAVTASHTIVGILTCGLALVVDAIGETFGCYNPKHEPPVYAY